MSIEEFKKAVNPKPKRGAKSAKLRERYSATPAAGPGEHAVLFQGRLFDRHDSIVVSIRLPLPPSANSLKVIRALPGKRPFLCPSTEYKMFKEAVKAAWVSHFNGWPPEPLQGRLRVRAVVHQARRGGDICNREKACIDALVECGAIADDEQIDDAHFIRGEIIKGTGAIDVTIETIQEVSK